MDKIIEIATQLAEEIKKDDRLISYNLLKDKMDADSEIQALIGEFGLKRAALTHEMEKGGEDKEQMERLNNELKEAYTNIMKHPLMQEFEEKKQALDEVLNKVNSLIAAAVNGEEEHSCSGSCATCGGCH